MKKSDLKKGMVVEIRIGKKLLIVNENNNENNKEKPFFDLTDNVYHYLSLNDDLLNADNHECDVIKVYKNYTCSKILWERPQELLTQEEKDYLKEILKGINCEVTSIIKGNYFIEIRLEHNRIMLPPYKCMIFKFEGMEVCKPYTLEELGLE